VIPLPTHDTPLAQAARRLAPFSRGWCLRCGLPWDVAQPHDTWCEWDGDGFPSLGMFALCEDCWSPLTVEERWPYYVARNSQWAHWNGDIHVEQLAYALHREQSGDNDGR
jgi:hypothetical protein